MHVVEIREVIALDVRIGSIQVDGVVIPAQKRVAQNLDDGTRPFSAREVDDIIVAMHILENIAFDDDIPVGGDQFPADGVAAGHHGKRAVEDVNR